MKKLRTHYDNLKVARDAPDSVIRAAYKILVQKYHPDKNPGDDRAARIMKIINHSYEILSNPTLRAEHDSWIASQETAEDKQNTSTNMHSSFTPPPPPKPPGPSSDNADGRSNYPPISSKKNFWRKLLDGEFGLAITFWLFLVFPGFIVSSVVNLIETLPSFENIPKWFALLALIYTAYWAAAAIGCWRAANKYHDSPIWSGLAKISVGIGWITLPVSLFLYLSILLPSSQSNLRTATNEQLAYSKQESSQHSGAKVRQESNSERNGERWIIVSEDAHEEHAIDTVSINRNNNIVTVWARIKYRSSRLHESGRYYSEFLHQNSYYCGESQVSLFQSGFFRDSSGASFGHFNSPPEKEPILPESYMETMYDAFCKKI